MFRALWLVSKTTEAGNKANSLLLSQSRRSANLDLGDRLLHLAQTSREVVFLFLRLPPFLHLSPPRKEAITWELFLPEK